MLEERIEARESPLSEIPEEHRPVIVKLAHERYLSCYHDERGFANSVEVTKV